MKRTVVINAVNNLPKEIKLDELLERLVVIEKIDAGINQAKEGKTVSHENVKKQIKKWSK